MKRPTVVRVRKRVQVTETPVLVSVQKSIIEATRNLPLTQDEPIYPPPPSFNMLNTFYTAMKYILDAITFYRLYHFFLMNKESIEMKLYSLYVQELNDNTTMSL